MLTSLSSPSASLPEQRSPKNAAYSFSQASVPARKRLTPPSIAPMSGGTDDCPSSSTASLVKLDGQVVRRIRRDAEARHEDDREHDRHHLEDLRERMRRPQLSVTRDGATAALCGLGRLAHRVLSDVVGVQARLPTQHTRSEAEGVGFEPTGHCCPLVFKTRSIGRSDNPPDGCEHPPTGVESIGPDYPAILAGAPGRTLSARFDPSTSSGTVGEVGPSTSSGTGRESATVGEPGQRLRSTSATPPFCTERVVSPAASRTS